MKPCRRRLPRNGTRKGIVFSTALPLISLPMDPLPNPPIKEALVDSKVSPRQQLRSSLAEIVQETAERGWDGCNAEPLAPLAIATADYVISLLPETRQRPEIVPAPNGEIAFEWNRGENYMFSIATHKGELVYAALLGPHRKQYGQEPLGDELPRPIATILEAHFSKV